MTEMLQRSTPCGEAGSLPRTEFDRSNVQAAAVETCPVSPTAAVGAAELVRQPMQTQPCVDGFHTLATRHEQWLQEQYLGDLETVDQWEQRIVERAGCPEDIFDRRHRG